MQRMSAADEPSLLVYDTQPVDAEAHSISKDEALWYLVTLQIFFKKRFFSHQYSIILCQERVLSVEMAPIFFFHTVHDLDVSEVSVPIIEKP